MIKKKITLEQKILFSFFFILVILLSVIGLTQYINMKKYLVNSKVRELQARCHTIDFKLLSSIDDVTDSNKILTDITAQLSDRLINIVVIDNNGHVSYKVDNNSQNQKGFKKDFSTTDNIKDFDRFKSIPISIVPIFTDSKYKTLLDTAGNLESNYEIVEKDEISQILIWRKIGDINFPSGLIQLSASVSDIHEILYKQLMIFAVISFSILFISLLIGRLIFRKALSPLEKMTTNVEKINASDLDVRLDQNTGILEIDSLSYSFNNMLERLKYSFEKEYETNEKMKEFISNASHELRTPLTSISGFVEVLLMGAAKNEAQLESSLKSILSESDRLTKLVNDLLILGRLDQNMNNEKFKQPLNNTICDLMAQLSILAEKRTVNFNLNTDIYATYNNDQIKQVLLNIFQNAVLHTDPLKGIINIDLTSEKLEDSTYSLIKISDNGSGIKKEHLNKVFHRFFRSESSRSRTNGGYGLGLSIVKSIIDAHNGFIRVESKVGLGTTFYIYLK